MGTIIHHAPICHGLKTSMYCNMIGTLAWLQLLCLITFVYKVCMVNVMCTHQGGLHGHALTWLNSCHNEDNHDINHITPPPTFTWKHTLIFPRLLESVANKILGGNWSLRKGCYFASILDSENNFHFNEKQNIHLHIKHLDIQ